MELVLGVPPQETRGEGEDEEFKLAERLAQLGFDTHCDGVARLAGTQGTRVLPHDHMVKIGPLLGRLIRELEAACLKNLADGEILDVLTGAAGVLGVSDRHEAHGRFRYLPREWVATAVREERRVDVFT